MPSLCQFQKLVIWDAGPEEKRQPACKGKIIPQLDPGRVGGPVPPLAAKKELGGDQDGADGHLQTSLVTFLLVDGKLDQAGILVYLIIRYRASESTSHQGREHLGGRPGNVPLFVRVGRDDAAVAWR